MLKLFILLGFSFVSSNLFAQHVFLSNYKNALYVEAGKMNMNFAETQIVGLGYAFNRWDFSLYYGETGNSNMAYSLGPYYTVGGNLSYLLIKDKDTWNLPIGLSADVQYSRSYFTNKDEDGLVANSKGGGLGIYWKIFSNQSWGVLMVNQIGISINGANKGFDPFDPYDYYNYVRISFHPYLKFNNSLFRVGVTTGYDARVDGDFPYIVDFDIFGVSVAYLYSF
ncbi:hypothetical protein EP331_14930 [bacterium]|nr:MAG: hypothetical protein EP331_14930 [bacterium]